MKEDTGIYSPVNQYDKGLEWVRLRDHAMKEGASLEFAIVRKTTRWDIVLDWFDSPRIERYQTVDYWARKDRQ